MFCRGVRVRQSYHDKERYFTVAVIRLPSGSVPVQQIRRIRSEGEGENSYHNPDFTPAMEIVNWQKELMINDHNPK